ncbi:FAD-binding protein [Sutterella wadsworthensis]|uniref:FAD-binding protein n=1 Tax=Sutterella wadsworthensis TaxID=40545 RepID=UPI003FEF76CB
MKQVLIAAAVAMTFAPAWAADQTYNVDVVVVGAGAGGTVAAVSAVEGGLKTLMLEKNAFAGGAGNFMEGSFAAESFMQKEKGVKLTKIQAFNEMAAYHHWRINAPLVKAFVDLSGDTIQWVYDHGVHWKEVKTAWRDKADLTWHIYPSAGSLPKAMVETFKAKGGTLLLSTPAEKLIYKDGKVEGVVAKNAKGDTITVNAKNVILATGGYNFNVDMVKKLTGIDMIPVGAPGRTGDGIKMAMDVGAIGDNMGPMMINGAFMPAEGEAICNGANKEVRALFRQGLLYVDSTGSRFFNEELTIDWPQASNAIARTGEWTYIVFDEATKREFSTEGKGYPNPCGNFIQRHQAATQLDALLKANDLLKDFDRSRPGCILLDVRMPDLSGPELQEKLNLMGSRVPIVFITSYSDIHAAIATLKAGADDFLLKPVDPEKLLEVVARTVERSQLLAAGAVLPDNLAASAASLTERPRRVLDLMMDGMNDAAIAERLNLSERTVQVYRAQIYKAYGVHSVKQFALLIPRLKAALSSADADS